MCIRDSLQEVDHFLDPANALLGVGEVTAYQIQLYGESGSPFIMSHDHTLPIRKIRKKVVIKQGKTSKVVMRRTEVDEVDPGSNKHAAGLGTLLLDATLNPVSYTHLRAHETVLDLVCRLLLEKKKQT
eukprot:TRINITY_DN3359_c0_g1_i1.p1 TRINITY_DN3359_c0_g1~~TRINITY_DN3359_c0_g1_i1.p1  ORF type:complete len:128 (+),score=68.72 TRINITY_DN3359_c0_g1_i1:80-463(+)